jgi:hypothetical protein
MIVEKFSSLIAQIAEIDYEIRERRRKPSRIEGRAAEREMHIKLMNDARASLVRLKEIDEAKK